MLFPYLALVVDPVSRDGALNMAIDEALVNHAVHPVLRVYRWKRASVSFGYFGQILEVEAAWPDRELVRRWTGGGIVPHGDDYTYTLVVPATFPFAQEPAISTYATVHARVASAIERHLGRKAALATGAAPKISNACFQNAVQHDIVLGTEKIAGAAQRRTKSGLLHQGSIQIPGLGDAFTRDLAATFSTVIAEEPLAPALLLQAEALAREKYATEKWLRRF
jgi:lipoate-protein ligase A